MPDGVAAVEVDRPHRRNTLSRRPRAELLGDEVDGRTAADMGLIKRCVPDSLDREAETQVANPATTYFDTAAHAFRTTHDGALS